MNYYIGLDVSDASINAQVMDKTGTVVKKFTTDSNPTALDLAFRQLNMPIEKIGLETGPKSNWIVRELRKKGWPVVLHDAFKMAKLIETKVNKTDDNDSQIIAETTLAGDLIPGFLKMGVHLKSPESENIRTIIRVRQSILRKNIDTYNEIRGILKAYGKAIPKTSPEAFSKVVTTAIEDLPFDVQLSISSLLQPYDPNRKLINEMGKRIDSLTEKDDTVKVLTTIPEVGNITALYIKATIDNPLRFTDSRSAGAYLGLCPSQYSSGESHLQGKISKRGDEVARSLLIGAATRILKPSAPPSALKTKGMELTKKCGKGKATVAIARKLMVIMHKMMITKKPYTEEIQRPPKAKKAQIQLTTEEIQRLAKLAEKNGHIVIRSAKHIKNLIKEDCPAEPAKANEKVKPFVNRHKRRKNQTAPC